MSKNGKWIKESRRAINWGAGRNCWGDTTHYSRVYYTCSICKEEQDECSNVCPNCGANMKGE